jgi:putative flippase GtrA
MNQSVGHQAVRYAIVGACVFAADFLLYIAVIQVAPGSYIAGNMFGKGVGALLGFVLHKHFTFSWRQRDNGMRQLANYLGLFLSNLALSSFLLWLLVDLAGIGRVGAKLVVDCIVIGTSFLVNRLWIYRAEV